MGTIEISDAMGCWNDMELSSEYRSDALFMLIDLFSWFGVKLRDM